jgi:hypothetical protein
MGLLEESVKSDFLGRPRFRMVVSRVESLFPEDREASLRARLRPLLTISGLSGLPEITGEAARPRTRLGLL